jgi:hypothetical protein
MSTLLQNQKTEDREFFDFILESDFDFNVLDIANSEPPYAHAKSKRKPDFEVSNAESRILRCSSLKLPLKEKSKKKKIINSGSLLAQFGDVNYAQLSRRARATKLFVFPSFDKCDALLYFPSTMSRYLNSGDLDRLGVLFDTHLDKKCQVIAPCDVAVDVGLCMKFFETESLWQADFVSCVHSTKVVEDEIISTVYFKFTDNQFIYNSVAGSVKEEAFKPVFCVDKLRSERFEAALKLNYLSEQEQDRVRSVLNSDVDVEVYGSVVFKLKIDSSRNKIVQFTSELSPNKLVLSSDPSVLIYADSKNPALYP